MVPAFLSYRLFLERAKVTAVYEEMAALYGISVEDAKWFLKMDVEAYLLIQEGKDYSLTRLGRLFLRLHIACARRDAAL